MALDHRRSFYPLVNLISALVRLGVQREVLLPLIREAEAKAKWEDIPPQDAGDVLRVTKSLVGVDPLERSAWLHALPAAVAGGGPRDIRRAAVWVSIISLNQSLAPLQTIEWARARVGRSKVMRSRIYPASFLALSAARLGLTPKAQRLTAKILRCRDENAGFWGNTDFSLTLRVATNLLDAGTANTATLGPTYPWLLEHLRDPESLSVRDLSVATECLILAGARRQRLYEAILHALPLAELPKTVRMQYGERGMQDVFISHASEDKDAVARPLAEELVRRGYRVWYDEYELKLGDSLRRSIDKGLASSRFGVVILSPKFLAKGWTNYELDGLAAREIGSGKVILPIWHDLTRDDLLAYSPTLADRKGIRTDRGIAAVADAIEDVLKP